MHALLVLSVFSLLSGVCAGAKLNTGKVGDASHHVMPNYKPKVEESNFWNGTSESAELREALKSFSLINETILFGSIHRDPLAGGGPVITDGLLISGIEASTGINLPQRGQTVTIHYAGTLLNGTKFDSTRDRNEPLSFRLGQGEVIKGLDEGVAQMSLGQRASLMIASDLAYGARGIPNVIHPYATLVFDVELLGFQ